MKIAIVHLSDFHINAGERFLSQKIDGVLSALNILGKENYAKGVVVKSTDAGITVDVYTVMSYGVKISEVSKNIQERVKFNLENQLGIKAETVNVYVQNIKVVGEN